MTSYDTILCSRKMKLRSLQGYTSCKTNVTRIYSNIFIVKPKDTSECEIYTVYSGKLSSIYRIIDIYWPIYTNVFLTRIDQKHLFILPFTNLCKFQFILTSKLYAINIEKNILYCNCCFFIAFSTLFYFSDLFIRWK